MARAARGLARSTNDALRPATHGACGGRAAYGHRWRAWRDRIRFRRLLDVALAAVVLPLTQRLGDEAVCARIAVGARAALARRQAS
jgi:hypothetical protein